MNKIIRILFSTTLLLIITVYMTSCASISGSSKSKKSSRNISGCWPDSLQGKESIYNRVKPLLKEEPLAQIKRLDYIVTVGVCYEYSTPEENTIWAVHRAVQQSLKNRNLDLISNLEVKLRSNPPSPSSFEKEYRIKVDQKRSSSIERCDYDIEVVDVQHLRSFESDETVYAKIRGRFSDLECRNAGIVPRKERSEYLNVMEIAQEICNYIGDKNFDKAKELIGRQEKTIEKPESIHDLYFGDSIPLSGNSLGEKYTGIYLGKGIFAAKIGKRVEVGKFGQERYLPNLNVTIDTGNFSRVTSLFSSNDFRLPDVVLECLFIKEEKIQ